MKNDHEGELAIPVEHTTAAHKLLMWPLIRRLITPNEYDEDYVMKLEEERGLINTHGQGAVFSSADDTQRPPLPTACDGGSFDGIQIIGDPHDLVCATSDPGQADIDKMGRLTLDVATARRYYQSYMDRIHQLHPFLNKPELDRKVETFIQSFCTQDTSQPPRSRTRQKRKRSVDVAAAPTRPRVSQSIDNAIMLLIFALGALDETKFPLPGPLLDRLNDLNDEIPASIPPVQVAPLNGVHDPNAVPPRAVSDLALPTPALYHQQLHNTSQSFLSSLSPANEMRASSNQSERMTSCMRNQYEHIKNLQRVPGLSLYEYATTILGLLQGGVELEHVQAGLLAGLYTGQLAHPFQSHGWVCQAARACQVLVRPKQYDRLEEGTTKDLYNFAYWTCLQLESDLLAELDLPASGISQYESQMGLPKGTFLHQRDEGGAPATMMVIFYSAQIHLCRFLNRVRTHLYKVEKQGQTRWSSNVQEALSENLNLWRTSLPTTMSWDDTEPPAKDIHAARMRAEYYGARYIIHRPLLYYALHHGLTGARMGSVAQTSVDSSTQLAGNPPS